MTDNTSVDLGVFDSKTRTITFTALPYPLPEPWLKQFVAAGELACAARRKRENLGVKEGLVPSPEESALLALVANARAEIGIEYTRHEFFPVLRD